jgi:hypothetical protein
MQPGDKLMRNTEEDYRGWPLRQRLELLAFDAQLAGVPQALLEVIDGQTRWGGPQSGNVR